MKRRRFDFFKGKKYDQMFRSYYNDVVSFYVGLVNRFGIKGGSARLGYRTGFRNKILYRLPNRKLVGRVSRQ
jgi:hypothetical protein